MAQLPISRPIGPTPRVSGGFGAPSFRGFQVSNDIGSAGQIANIDARGFVAEADSAGAIGQGLQSLGNDASRIYVAQQRVVGRRKELEVETMRSAASEDIAKKLADEKDETKWPELVAKEAEAHAKVWNEKSLSPETRDNIAAADVAWKHQLISSAGANSRQRSIQLLGDTYRGQIHALRNAGDFQGARAKVAEAHKDGVITEGSMIATHSDIDMDEKAAGRLRDTTDANGAILSGNVAAARDIIANSPHFDEQQRKAQLQDVDYKYAVNETEKQVDTLVRTNPAKLIEMLNDPKSFPALDANGRARAKDAATRSQEVAAGTSIEQAKRAIDLAKIAGGIDKATVETLGVDLSQATPWHRAVIAGELDKAKRGTDGAIAGEYQTLYATAADYKPEQDTNGIQAARLATLAATLPSAYAEKITAKIEEKIKGVQGFDPGPGLTRINEAVKRQMVFGSPEVPLKDEATGAALLKKEPTRYIRQGMKKDWIFDNVAQPGETPDYYKEVPDEAGATYTPDKVIDKVEAERIAALQERIANEFEKKAKAGEFKTEEDANDWIGKAIRKAGGKPATMPTPTGPSAALMGTSGFDAARKAQEILSK